MNDDTLGLTSAGNLIVSVTKISCKAGRAEVCSFTLQALCPNSLPGILGERCLVSWHKSLHLLSSVVSCLHQACLMLKLNTSFRMSGGRETKSSPVVMFVSIFVFDITSCFSKSTLGKNFLICEH